MARIGTHIIALVAATAIATAVTVAQKRPVAKKSAAPVATGCVTTLTASDWSGLLENIGTVNPTVLQRLKDDANLRSGQVENIRELLAFGCQAVKDGVLNDPINRAEFDNIRAEITASEYEKAIAKPAPNERLGSVSDARASAFYKLAGNETRFDAYLKTKLALIDRAKPDEPARTLTPEDRAAARVAFAKISLLAADSSRPAAATTAGLRQRIALQVRLQQAQFLAQMTAEKLGNSVATTDEEINKYLAEHTELDVSARKAKAEGILKRALSGEDFATLANTYSEDPGNMGPDGKPQGGLYTNVPQGKMIPEFEKTALGLQPGSVSTVLTPSDYGFHIIKLERKSGTGDSLRYNVRHILISTTFPDPDDPNGRPVPAAEFARRTIEKQRADEITAKIIRDNPVAVADIVTAAAPAKKSPVVRRRTGK
jgi:PPIC-type PPIASE domain